MSMSRLLNGHLHPLLVHFPIGLVLTAAMAETVALATGIKKWRVVAVANLRLGSVFALAAAATGWLLAASSAVEDAHTLGNRGHGADGHPVGTNPKAVLRRARSSDVARRRDRSYRWRAGVGRGLFASVRRNRGEVR